MSSNDIFQNKGFYIVSPANAITKYREKNERWKKLIQSNGGRILHDSDSAHIDYILIHDIPLDGDKLLSKSKITADTYTSGSGLDCEEDTMHDNDWLNGHADHLNHSVFLPSDEEDKDEHNENKIGDESDQRDVVKVILRIGWIDDCLKAGRILSEKDNWGGCRVKQRAVGYSSSTARQIGFQTTTYISTAKDGQNLNQDPPDIMSPSHSIKTSSKPSHNPHFSPIIPCSSPSWSSMPSSGSSSNDLPIQQAEYKPIISYKRSITNLDFAFYDLSRDPRRSSVVSDLSPIAPEDCINPHSQHPVAASTSPAGRALRIELSNELLPENTPASASNKKLKLADLSPSRPSIVQILEYNSDELSRSNGSYGDLQAEVEETTTKRSTAVKSQMSTEYHSKGFVEKEVELNSDDGLSIFDEWENLTEDEQGETGEKQVEPRSEDGFSISDEWQIPDNDQQEKFSEKQIEMSSDYGLSIFDEDDMTLSSSPAPGLEFTDMPDAPETPIENTLFSPSSSRATVDSPASVTSPNTIFRNPINGQSLKLYIHGPATRLAHDIEKHGGLMTNAKNADIVVFTRFENHPGSLVPTTPEETALFQQAFGRSQRVLSSKWIGDSFAAGTLLPEERYSIWLSKIYTTTHRSAAVRSIKRTVGAGWLTPQFIYEQINADMSYTTVARYIFGS
ncbi:uncharacterized protein IL334_006933 [Kwoniella shivajii]|uniref:BRCT domain-containing protein n=1 Tax=Kwoniella shivajii TaxID=564305 RepID=A0ABZ1DBA5_9TREE|nr:hypothetical protein IL334_006933 [Kwoniella shivajii]